jgi:hypothetical protein
LPTPEGPEMSSGRPKSVANVAIVRLAKLIRRAEEGINAFRHCEVRVDSKMRIR